MEVPDRLYITAAPVLYFFARLFVSSSMAAKVAGLPVFEQTNKLSKFVADLEGFLDSKGKLKILLDAIDEMSNFTEEKRKSSAQNNEADAFEDEINRTAVHDERLVRVRNGYKAVKEILETCCFFPGYKSLKEILVSLFPGVPTIPASIRKKAKEAVGAARGYSEGGPDWTEFSWRIPASILNKAIVREGDLLSAGLVEHIVEAAKFAARIVEAAKVAVKVKGADDKIKRSAAKLSAELRIAREIERRIMWRLDWTEFKSSCTMVQVFHRSRGTAHWTTAKHQQTLVKTGEFIAKGEAAASKAAMEAAIWMQRFDEFVNSSDWKLSKPSGTSDLWERRSVVDNFVIPEAVSPLTELGVINEDLSLNLACFIREHFSSIVAKSLTALPFEVRVTKSPQEQEKGKKLRFYVATMLIHACESHTVLFRAQLEHLQFLIWQAALEKERRIFRRFWHSKNVLRAIYLQFSHCAHTIDVLSEVQREAGIFAIEEPRNMYNELLKVFVQWQNGPNYEHSQILSKYAETMNKIADAATDEVGPEKKAVAWKEAVRTWNQILVILETVPGNKRESLPYARTLLRLAQHSRKTGDDPSSTIKLLKLKSREKSGAIDILVAIQQETSNEYIDALSLLCELYHAQKDYANELNWRTTLLRVAKNNGLDECTIKEFDQLKYQAQRSKRVQEDRNRMKEGGNRMMTEKEQEYLKNFLPCVDGNPRRIKRIVNVYNVQRFVVRAGVGSGTDDLDDELSGKLLKFVILLEQWPYRMAWLIKYIENNSQWHDILKDRPAAALNVLPSAKKLEEDDDIFEVFALIVHGLIYSPSRKEERDRHLNMDSDPELFLLLLKQEPKISVGELLPSHEDDDRIRLLQYAFNINPGILSSVSHYLDELSINDPAEKSDGDAKNSEKDTEVTLLQAYKNAETPAHFRRKESVFSYSSEDTGEPKVSTQQQSLSSQPAGGGGVDQNVMMKLVQQIQQMQQQQQQQQQNTFPDIEEGQEEQEEAKSFLA